ncbi:ABC transporter ATP-binding protein [Streptomyces sp. NBRC 109706]|uniref:ABC transporter ATP-binding protein n=1 Tax=Streptomyces sp. NBRC 109706 TaxID=1550035 RepID=UPI0007852A83|nr:ATP-binding cassette domain-containing protein [Streptomyces sp. NBRC 109706]
MSDIVARVDELRIEVAGRALLDGVSLTVRAGRCTALLGPSGSGKSTTGLALLGEHPAGARVSGTVSVSGRAGYVPQQPSAALNPARRSGALLGDIARRAGGRRGERAGRVREALLAAQLPEPDVVVRRHPHQLSGGQQQRVVLAQVLLSGAPVVVADEPTTGLDPLTRRRVLAELRTLLNRGAGLLLLSHDLAAVDELADEVVLLAEGRVVDAGPADELLTPPTAPVPRAARPAGEAGEAGGSGGEPLLAVTGLTAWHGRRTSEPVLHPLSLRLDAGRCLAVLGRSGSGKTTLARCLAGLHHRWSGEVSLAGRALAHGLRDRERAQLAGVQYVFQDARASFDAYRPVLDQVARGAVRLRGQSRAEAEERALATLARTGVDPATARRRPPGLSGGELQRAALARALLTRPEVLLCDEITSGLDPTSRDAIRKLLAEVLADGGAVLLITHDPAVAAALADDVAVLDAGRLVESGPLDTVSATPEHPVTRGTFGPRP